MSPCGSHFRHVASARKTVPVLAGHDEVVPNDDTDRSERAHQLLSGAVIGRRRFCPTRRVIVSKDHCVGLVPEGDFYCLAGFNVGAVRQALDDQGRHDHSALGIEAHHAKDFLGPAGHERN